MMRVAVAFAKATMAADTRLCTACIDLLHVSGAGITVMSGDQAGPLCVSNARMSALEDLQFTAGEGPCRDAFVSHRPVFAPQLDRTASARWPAFVDLAIASGVGAVFAYPLSSSGSTVGVLTLYEDRAGSLTGEQHDDSLAVAEVLGETVLGLQDSTPDGDLAPILEDAIAYRAQVHQAAGMVAIQLRVATLEALVRIRAYAFANNMSVDDVATDIVARRLRLADDRPGSQEGS